MFNKNLFQEYYRVPSLRLPHWDYSCPGGYFITICTQQKYPFFGVINHGQMELSKIGEIAKNELLKTEIIRNNMTLDTFVIMPNHVHIIVHIIGDVVETHCNASLQNTNCNASLQNTCNTFPRNTYNASLHNNPNKFGPQINNLASIVRGYKSSVKRKCDKLHYIFYWQPRYYERIIRTPKELNIIRKYIKNNPINYAKRHRVKQ